MRITYETKSNLFVAVSSFDERMIPKSAGFQWDAQARRWSTRSAQKAERLAKYADAKAKQRLLEMAGSPRRSGASLTWNADRKRFEWVSDKEMKNLPKEAGFRWDPDRTVWHTTDPSAAKTLIEYADDATKARLGEAIEALQQAIEASRTANADADLPRPEGLDYLPYQTAGVLAALDRRNVLLGDSMGLGKTIQAIGTFNADPEATTMLVIAPASLKINWQREIEKWSVKPVKVGIATGKKFPDESHNVVVTNYENVKKQRPAIDARQWDVLVCDESHYLKNEKAQRTKAVLGSYDRQTKTKDPGIQAGRVIMMTGTPVLNRPKELWTTVKRLDPDGLGRDFMQFAKRYCGARQTEWGWNFDGAANLDELQEKLRATIMVRRTKDEVLTDLPPKIRQVMPLEPDRQTKKLIDEQNKVAASTDQLKGMISQLRAEGAPGFEAEVNRLKDKSKVAFSEMAKLRHELAVAKIPSVIEHIKECLDSGSDKIIVFGHHHDVIDAIADEFGDEAEVITGETPNAKRQEAVDRFQTDPTCKVFIGNIQAAGVGLTLTASSHVVMAELDWTPANVSQAEDRAHRIGQTDSVLVQHLVFDESLDARMAQRMVEKQNIADQVLDKTNPQAAAARQERIDAMIEHTERRQSAEREHNVRQAIESVAKLPAGREARERREAEAREKITPAQIAQVHRNARVLAGVCDGAVSDDDRGFNGMDSRYGHRLAHLKTLSASHGVAGRRMLAKYKRQLGEDAVRAMYEDPLAEESNVPFVESEASAEEQ